jgi:hypothetical protein
VFSGRSTVISGDKVGGVHLWNASGAFQRAPLTLYSRRVRGLAIRSQTSELAVVGDGDAVSVSVL